MLHKIKNKVEEFINYLDGIVDENLCLDFRGKGTKCRLLLLNIIFILILILGYTGADDSLF